MLARLINPIRLQNLKLTALINGYSLLKIPLLAFVLPRVIESSELRSVVEVRLGARTRNHLRVMYFGALAIGAELSVALRAIQAIRASGKRIDFIFKDFKCEFLKRADEHVHFSCDAGAEVTALIEEAAQIGDRISRTFTGKAYLANRPNEVVMTYALTLSVRQRLKIQKT